MVIAGLLLYCWTTIFTSDIDATWRHYIGLLLFIPITILFFKDFTKAVIGLDVYLLLATFNLLALTPAISTSWISIGAFTTPPVQLLSLGILVLYFFLNMETIIDIQLDDKEAKENKAKSRLKGTANTGVEK